MKNDKARQPRARSGGGGRETPQGGLPQHIDPRKPAGNAQFDPAQQTRRMDMPKEAQKGRGEAKRGTAPSRAADRSRQPHKHEGEA
jgi:hypothetical protein